MINLPPDHTLEIRSVKHARIRVTENKQVLVIVPPEFSDEDVTKLLEKKRLWTQDKLKYFSKKKEIQLQRNQILMYGNRYSFFYDSDFQRKVQVSEKHFTIRAKRDLTDLEIQEKWLKTVAKKYLVTRIKHFSEQLHLPFEKLYVRSQRKKWGNCSKEKNISINWRIVKAPKFVIDYIIIHELVHTIRMDHTVKFWTLLRTYCPDYKKAVKWLDVYGNSL